MTHTFKNLAKELCKKEGKKKQVNIAQMSEILKDLRELLYADSCWFEALFSRFTPAKKKIKKKI